MRKETEFGEKLRSVLESIDSLTWRDKSGNDVKLVDASVEDLRNDISTVMRCYITLVPGILVSL